MSAAEPTQEQLEAAGDMLTGQDFIILPPPASPENWRDLFEIIGEEAGETVPKVKDYKEAAALVGDAIAMRILQAAGLQVHAGTLRGGRCGIELNGAMVGKGDDIFLAIEDAMTRDEVMANYAQALILASQLADDPAWFMDTLFQNARPFELSFLAGAVDDDDEGIADEDDDEPPEDDLDEDSEGGPGENADVIDMTTRTPRRPRGRGVH